MIEQGVVISVKKEFALVRVGRNSACGSCGKCGMTEKQKHVDFYASNAVGAVQGDTVAIDIPETNSAKLALVAYVIPLAPALGLMLTSVALKWYDWLSAVLFFAGLAVGFAVVALIDRFRKHKWMETPEIKEIVNKTVVQQTNIEKGDSNNE